MAVLKQKMPIFWKRSPTKKNVTAQKSLRICFYLYLGETNPISVGTNNSNIRKVGPK